MSKLIVQLVAWNGEKYIPSLFDSLKKQTYRDWSLLVLDNASTDATLARIKREAASLSVDVLIFESDENLGFSGGHNRLFQKEDASEYVLLLNQDMYLDPDCFERMVRFLDNRKKAAALSPRLMKWDFQKSQQPAAGSQQSFSDTIDSLGLKVFRSRRVVEWYTGERWSEIQDDFSEPAVEVFGVSGALPIYRRSALREVAFLDGSIFDPSYHSYKEDVDLAFRLRSAGFAAYVLLDAVAYHDRTAAGPKGRGNAAAIRNKSVQSRYVRYTSYKNHLATLYKNEYWQSALLDFPWIFWYELKKFLYYLFIDPRVLRGLFDLWRIRKDLRRRKDQIVAKRTASWREVWRHIGA